MTKTTSLFAADAAFVSEQTDAASIFKEVYEKLLDLGYVKSDFLTNIIKREKDYPTGVDTSPISKDLPNIAIPHTEGEYVNTRLIVPISLKEPVVFRNMIAPDEKLQVKFLFMILNNDPEGQANVLAQIMGFLSSTPVSELTKLFNLSSPAEIYQFLNEKFEQE